MNGIKQAIRRWLEIEPRMTERDWEGEESPRIGLALRLADMANTRLRIAESQLHALASELGVDLGVDAAGEASVVKLRDPAFLERMKDAVQAAHQADYMLRLNAKVLKGNTEIFEQWLLRRKPK